MKEYIIFLARIVTAVTGIIIGATLYNILVN